jgi:hypothetical protein
MERIQGSKGVELVECINPVKGKWRVRWNVVEDENGASWLERDFDHKPTLAEIKDVVLSWYNQDTDKKILSGFVWNGMSVWLSEENQRNFKSAFDAEIFLQSMGQSSLPLLFKLDEDENGDAIYFTFESMSVFADFYLRALGYVKNTIAEGWLAKDAIDWSAYEVE